MWIISVLIIILTLSILKDTHVKVYGRYATYCSIQTEYDLVVPVWAALMTVVLGLMPVVSIVSFIVFAIYYAVHAWWDPEENYGESHVFSLRGDNIITRGLLRIKNLLCKRI